MILRKKKEEEAILMDDDKLIEQYNFKNKEGKENMKKFLLEFNEMVKVIQAIDEDTTLLSFDEFLLLFVRIQPKIREWNALLPPYESKQLNYILKDKSLTEILTRFHPHTDM